MKENIYHLIDEQRDTLLEMADFIHDNPEYDGEEVQASALLTDYLKKNGFEVQLGLGSWPTAFRAVWHHGQGGPRIGLLCEYDALPGMGHACAHHLQGPSICGAAVALKNAGIGENFSIVVYGTPAEETRSAKVSLQSEGFFSDIDVALMMHGGPDTCVDIKSMALTNYTVVFKGISAHAALAPEKGRSALDALLLSFQGVEFMREHVRDDVRMHYTVSQLPGPVNVVPDHAVGSFSLRSYSTEVLAEVCKRFEQLVHGAAMMADVTCEITQTKALMGKIPALRLNELVMENAKACNAPGLAPAREKTGSTDFGNIMHQLPGCCIRVKFVPAGTSSHSQTFVECGKNEDAHLAILAGAKTLAGTAMDIITVPDLLQEIRADFEAGRARV